MPTIEQNKAYLEDSSRFPKRQVNPLLQPHFQHTSEEYNRIIEYLAQLYERTCQAVTQVDGVLDTLSTNPVQNAVVAARFSEIDVRLLRCRVAFFQDIIASGSDRQVSIPTDGTPSEVFFFEAQSTFGLVPGGSAVSGSQYYNNWGRRAIYTDDLLQPFDDKLYFCIEERKLYVWDGEELVSVGGDKITIDTALSSISANPVQNKAVTAELNRLQAQIDSIETPVIRHFEIDAQSGYLFLTEAGGDDSYSFQIDDNGNLIISLE